MSQLTLWLPLSRGEIYLLGNVKLEFISVVL